ncbi:hAT family C-terminal dimerization region [Phytophthora infestans]|uniref:HAT family C-terminal dimerization region n=1 Tax=Phytophthora infestans TaxID=4787 RepID=A0A833T7X6_PHYIN|nr:hAT family C-terminal dimerization region [Phytophthora infestans]KAF4143557.1 hAT family C-terminal dimerization region [Phytophthora infestans]
MPRPPSPLWEHFSKEMPNKRASCNYCGLNMCGLVIRMRMHLARKCSSCPELVKAEMCAEIGRKHQASTEASVQPAKKARTTTNNTQPTDQASGEASAPTSHTPLHEEAPTAPTAAVAVLDDKSDLDGYVARAIFGAGLPVTTVEHSTFVKMLKRMNPTYEPPSAFVLATSVLDLEYSEVQIRLRAEVLDSTAVGFGIESTEATQKRLLMSCVINKSTPAAFGVENAGDIPHTQEVLVDKIESTLMQIGTGRVSVIVTDTSASMKQASQTLQNKYPAITFLPSCVHIMNVMMAEMLGLPTIATTLDTCQKLARFFAQDELARNAFARVSEQTHSVEVPAPLGDPDDLSPNGLLECLFTVERNRHSLNILLAENGMLNNLTTQIKEQIISLDFWDEMSMFTELFEPFLELLKMFETDFALSSTFYHRFTLLWAHLDKSGSRASKFKYVVSTHWQNLQHPAMYTAYLLDPRFPPSSLSGEATSEALAYIKRTSNAEVYGAIVDELTRFTARTGLFADDAIWESAQKCSPLTWWKGFIGSSCPNLQPVALRTLGFPVSSGLSKSQREMFDKIQAMNAKDMSEEQASKAAVVYLNSNLVASGEDGVASTETRV